MTGLGETPSTVALLARELEAAERDGQTTCTLGISLVRSLLGAWDGLLQRAEKEPINLDISDYGDEWCSGFLRGQVSILEEIAAGRLDIPGCPVFRTLNLTGEMSENADELDDLDCNLVLEYINRSEGPSPSTALDALVRIREKLGGAAG